MRDAHMRKIVEENTLKYVLFPQTDLSVGVLAVLLESPVVIALIHHEGGSPKLL